MTRYVWNGGAGSYTDPAQWADGAVPLWDKGSTVVIAGGAATLQDVDVLVTDDAVSEEQRERLLAVDVAVEVAR